MSGAAGGKVPSQLCAGGRSAIGSAALIELAALDALLELLLTREIDTLLDGSGELLAIAEKERQVEAALETKLAHRLSDRSRPS